MEGGYPRVCRHKHYGGKRVHVQNITRANTKVLQDGILYRTWCRLQQVVVSTYLYLPSGTHVRPCTEENNILWVGVII